MELGYQRTAEQDVAFGFRELVDLAVKAISPGVLDSRARRAPQESPEAEREQRLGHAARLPRPAGMHSDGSEDGRPGRRRA